jgi:hypothetical protein
MPTGEFSWEIFLSVLAALFAWRVINFLFAMFGVKPAVPILAESVTDIQEQLGSIRSTLRRIEQGLIAPGSDEPGMTPKFSQY